MRKSTVVSTPVSKFARDAALLSFAASAAFILCLGALHVLRPDLNFAPSRVSGLHEVGAMLDSAPLAALLINWSLSQNGAWSSVRRTLAWTAGIPLLGLMIFLLSLAVMPPRNGGQPGPEVLAGWPNRIMILAHCAWLMPIAWLTAALTQANAGLANIGAADRMRRGAN